MSKLNDAYSTAFKNWPKLAGSKPTLDMLNAAHALGCRPGKQALAMAMYSRDGGATDGQVKLACIAGWGASGSHHNKRRDLQRAKLISVVTEPMVSPSGHTILKYLVKLTATGQARLTKVAEVTAPVAKPAKAAKKAKPVVAPVAAETAPVTAPEATQA
jgi:hypothetical protein